MLGALAYRVHHPVLNLALKILPVYYQIYHTKAKTKFLRIQLLNFLKCLSFAQGHDEQPWQ